MNKSIKYEAPTAEVMMLEAEDVITSSLSFTGEEHNFFSTSYTTETFFQQVD